MMMVFGLCVWVGMVDDLVFCEIDWFVIEFEIMLDCGMVYVSVLIIGCFDECD